MGLVPYKRGLRETPRPFHYVNGKAGAVSHERGWHFDLRIPSPKNYKK